MLAGKGSDQGELLSTRIICLPGNPKIHRERRKPQADYKHHTEAKKSALQHLSLPPTSWEPNVTTYIQCHTHARCWWCPEVRKTQFPPPLWQKSSLDQQVRCWYHRCPQHYRADLLQLHIGLPHYYCCCGWFSHFSHSAQKRLYYKKDLQKDLAQKEDSMPTETWCAGPPWPGTHVSHHIISFSIETPLCGTALTEKSNKRFLLCFEMQ